MEKADTCAVTFSKDGINWGDIQITLAPNEASGFEDGKWKIWYNGSESIGLVSRKAYELNVPLYVTEGEVSDNTDSFFKTEGEIVIESIKMAEDSNKTIIRAYEPYGNTVDASFIFDSVVKLTETDLMEKDIKDSLELSTYKRKFKPFEIVTFKVE